MVINMKSENIWFWSPCWLVSARKNENPIKRPERVQRTILELQS